MECIISTNALGLVRNVNFYDSDNNLDQDLRPQDVKDSFDAKSLIPSLETFFQLHPNFTYKYFLGDSGFDADDNYAYLHKKNIMPIINLNPRNSQALPQPGFNEIGIPLCPKVEKVNTNGKLRYVLSCENPCTPSRCGRIKQLTIHHNYRFNTSMPRDSIKWQKLYRLRTICERSISQIKNFIQIKTSKIKSKI